MATAHTRAVLFDMDGVLVDSYQAWFELVVQAAAHFSCAAVTREAFAAGWGQGVDQDVVTFYPGRNVEEVDAYYLAHFGDYADSVRVDAAARGVLAELRRRRVHSAVITNTPSAVARQIIAAAKLAPDLIVGATDVARPKPAPDMVRRALDRLGVAPTEALVLGDSRFDREAARGAGVHFVGLRLDGDARIESLDQILTQVT